MNHYQIIQDIKNNAYSLSELHDLVDNTLDAEVRYEAIQSIALNTTESASEREMWEDLENAQVNRNHLFSNQYGRY